MIEILESSYIKKIQIRNKRGNLYLAVQTYLNYLIDGGKKDIFDIMDKIDNESIKKYYDKELRKIDLYQTI
jgi:hypothetical protein